MKLPNVILESKDGIVSVKEIVHHETPCEACGKPCVDRRLRSRQVRVPKVHWRTKCESCNLWRDPESGLFVHDSNSIQERMRQYYCAREVRKRLK
jgi:hypothetical protein